jgi:hypothetical protein
MPKYTQDDHLQVVEEKIVIYFERPQQGGPSTSPPPPDDAAAQPAGTAARAAADRTELAGMQAAALTSAAQKGVPFCAECERARREQRGDRA